ncbi:sugar ABC transporter substrate-binding protein [Shinella pollutisoli]|uniref:Sugar ABC transporter substrate-binding protein n=1 Tax=Shinella pollutisoli TaxID=2250594 RepID=A0ABV7DGX0_9HYPH|nr:sugar ABC transporter substrate-binding protein [Shinella pollutisoli]
MKQALRKFALAVGLGFLLAPGLAGAEDMRVIMVSHGQAADAFHGIVKNGFFQAGKDLGVSVDYRAPETFDMVAMGQLIDAAVNQRPDGIVVTLPDTDALGPAVKRAVESGIPVIAVNSGQDAYKTLGALAFVGQDEALAARMAGERLKEAGGKKAICINVEPGNVTIDIRCNSFTEGFGGAVNVLQTSMDPADIEAKVRAALQADPEIDTILSTAAMVAGEPALKALKATGQLGKINLGSFDLSPAMLEAVRDGNAIFCIDQQQYMYGYLPVALLQLYKHSKIVPANDVLTGPRFVTKDMAAEVIDLSTKGIR